MVRLPNTPVPPPPPRPMSWECEYCGIKNSLEAKRCRECGAPKR